MGYRSDVHIAVAFDSKKNMDEVIAAYALNINVEKHNLVNDWVCKNGHYPFVMIFSVTKLFCPILVH